MKVTEITLATALAAVALLAACATPLQQCLIAANQDVLDTQRELDERRANIRRGYAIERVLMPELSPAMCPAPGGVFEPCMRWAQETREIHHPINPEFERERVALLAHQLQRAEAAADRATAQCRARFPES